MAMTSRRYSNDFNNGNNDIKSDRSASQLEWPFIHENGHSPSSQLSVRQTMPEVWRHIKVPFPPEINLIDLVKLRKDGTPRKRCANPFLIYRIQFAEALRTHGHKMLLMTEISSMAGDAWKEEPDYVVRWYRDAANQVKRLHAELVRSSKSAKLADSLSSSETDEVIDNIPYSMPSANQMTINPNLTAMHIPYIEWPNYYFQVHNPNFMIPAATDLSLYEDNYANEMYYNHLFEASPTDINYDYLPWESDSPQSL